METKKSGIELEKIGTPIALLIGLLAIAGALYMGRPATPPPTEQAKDAASTVNIADVSQANSPYIGNMLAPATVAVWIDYQCKFCKLLEQQAMKQIRENYVDGGKVKIIIKDYQFLGEASTEAAVYSRAVWEVAKDKWVLWFDAMMAGTYANAERSNATFNAAATSVGINAEAVSAKALANRSEYLARIEADREEGAKFGISGTPATIIGTELIGGAKKYEEFESALIKVMK